MVLKTYKCSEWMEKMLNEDGFENTLGTTIEPSSLFCVKNYFVLKTASLRLPRRKCSVPYFFPNISWLGFAIFRARAEMRLRSQATNFPAAGRL